MNKNAIKKFAIKARKKLIASVSDRAGMLGITAEGCSEPISKGIDFEVYKTVAGIEVTLNRTQCEQRRKLREQIEARGFEAVVEEIAYTWFNRICAIRFMEVNDYLPTRVRVLSSEKEGKNEPDIVTQAPDVDLDFTEKEKEYILDCKMNNKLDELFKMLFIKQCNKLSEILPELFEATEDYTEMLLNISYTNKDDIIHMLVNQETGISEADFNVSTIGEDGQPTGQVEIIGWLYQYYNTELKDDTFAQLKKNVKISKERIPAVTQLFTPDWIVRYMVENSVGRLWIEHLRAVDPTVNEKEVAEKFGWKYYLPEAEQEADVNVKLAEIRTNYKDLKPKDITCIDPCMGSGHILVAMFDVLMDIYKSAGYSERDAALEIVEHNIYGLDIDKRAYQLAYFAVMMKGRGYNRRFFKELVHSNVHVIKESNTIKRKQLELFGARLNEQERKNLLNQLYAIMEIMTDAREYGSILKLDNFNLELLYQFVKEFSSVGQITFETLGIEETQRQILELLDVAEVMIQKYDVVITNPPYMAISNGNVKLNNYVKKNYPDSKADLFAVFIEKCGMFAKQNGYQAMITQHAWMFLASFEKLRAKILEKSIVNMAHLGARAFEEIGGEVVQTTAFVIRNHKLSRYLGKYSRLVDKPSQNDKKEAYLQHIDIYVCVQDQFELIPGAPIAYWVSDNIFSTFNNRNLGEYAYPKAGLQTNNNDLFLRLWFEIPLETIYFHAHSQEEAICSKKKWFPYNKGGSFRRWYGNNYLLVNWENGGYDIHQYAGIPLEYRGAPVRAKQYYFKESVTWSAIASGKLSVRYCEDGFVFDTKGSSCFFEDKNDVKYFLALLNCVVTQKVLEVLAPTLDYSVGALAKLPVIYAKEHLDEISCLAEECVELARRDWDCFEMSWDFITHPLVNGFKFRRIEDAFENWKVECDSRVKALKRNEEYLNAKFIDIYDLSNELIPTIEEQDITVRRAELQRDIKSLISYAVGCMFGRYSLDENGLVYAGGVWDTSKFSTFMPDRDNIIPIVDEEFFDDDIVGLFCAWVKKVYGKDTLEENLDFIAKALDNKGNTSREVLRNYFLNDFFKDHCNTYSVTGLGKRPIYWLFDSGKENGFKCLIYMHRYNADVVGKIRTDYLHRTQKAIEQAMQSAEYVKDNSTNGTEKSGATKRIAKYTKQLAEIKQYDEAMAHIANQRIELDLDDGVKVNYAKFQGVEVAKEGKIALKVDLLAKIK